MKAYLVRTERAVPPFRKPASQLRLKGCTLESRLRAQLRSAGLDVVEVSGPVRPAAIEPGSLVLQDDLLLSNHLVRRFLAALPNRRGNYQCEIDASRFPMMSPREGPPSYRALPLFYYGDDPRSPQVAPVKMQSTSLHEVEQGLPRRMHVLTDLRVHFLDYYGIQIEYWFDIQTASSLYCRELVADLLRPVRAALPEWAVSWITSRSWLMERCNRVGRTSRIHPTAILEGCEVGEGVEIGPFAYLRSSVIGDGAVIRERSSIKGSYIGERSFVMGSDVVNAYVGAETAIVCPMLYNVVFGERGFISGGSGFADFIVGGGSVVASIEGKDVPSNLSFLGSAVGDDCFLGANLLFAPGRTIPDGTRLLDHGLIKEVPRTPDGVFVRSGPHLLQVPESFVGGVRRS